VDEWGMIITYMVSTVDQKMFAVAWDALYDTTRNNNQYPVRKTYSVGVRFQILAKASVNNAAAVRT
jgi:hypothetical protein